MWQMTPSEVVLPAAKLVIKLQGHTCFLVAQDMQLRLLWQAHLALGDRHACQAWPVNIWMC